MLSVTVEDVRLFLHVLAATVWVGGQLTLAGLVPVLRRVSPQATTAAARGFNRIAWPAFGVLIATGIWNIAADHSQVSHDADFRNTLWAKLGVVALSGLTAYLHTRAQTRQALAVFGAATGLFALGALFLGIVLSHG